MYATNRWPGLNGRILRTPNVLEFFIFMVLILFAFYFTGVINNGSSGAEQILLLTIAAGSSAMIGTLIKTYFEREVLFM